MTIALERSTVAVTASFRDENDELITPTGITWSLTDGEGNIINGRENVAISTANTVTIVLIGDDMAMTAGDDGRRHVVIRAQYNGDLGNGLPIVGVIEFTVRNILGVV